MRLNNKLQWVLTILFLLLIVSASLNIRTQSLNNLRSDIDGEYLPTGLDPYYFMRLAELKMEGDVPEFDPMRIGEVELYSGLTPEITIIFYKIANLFGDVSFDFIFVLTPVILFSIILIFLFILSYLVTQSKIASLLSTSLFSLLPSLLYRTSVGFTDHDILGIFAFLLVLVVFLYSMKKFNYLSIFLTSLTSAFCILSWRGISNYVFLIIPFTIFLYWVFANKKEEILEWYLGWVILTPLLTWALFFKWGWTAWDVISKFYLTIPTAIVMVVFGYIIIDWLLMKYTQFNRNKRMIYSGIVLFVIGILVLLLMGNLVSEVTKFFNMLVSPTSTSRIGSTISENMRPSLSSWVAEFGLSLFIMGILGLFILTIKVIKKQFENVCITPTEAFLLSWSCFVILSMAGSARLTPIISPFFCIIAGYTLVNIYEGVKSKEETVSLLYKIFTILMLLLMVSTMFSFFIVINKQSGHIHKSISSEWEDTMEWVREETPEDSVFSHWWDYGYWVQTLGERKTISDGGHFQGEMRNHLFARYVLTTDNPESAHSFLQASGVDYLLIDGTDFGKYGAYSKIGSLGDGEWDRFSYVGSGELYERGIVETRNLTIYPYMVGGGVDEDIIVNGELIPGFTYNENGDPYIHSYLNNINIVYNHVEENITNIELNYIVDDRTIKVNASDINVTIITIPSIVGDQVNIIGSLIYLSPRVSKSLYTRLYILNEDIPGFELVYQEDSPITKSLPGIGEMVYYQGMRSPIKIYKLNYPNDTMKIEDMGKHETNLDYWEWGMYDEVFK